MSSTAWADMAFGFLLGMASGGAFALAFVYRQHRAAGSRWRQILDPTRGYLDEE